MRKGTAIGSRSPWLPYRRWEPPEPERPELLWPDDPPERDPLLRDPDEERPETDGEELFEEPREELLTRAGLLLREEEELLLETEELLLEEPREELPTRAGLLVREEAEEDFCTDPEWRLEGEEVAGRAAEEEEDLRVVPTVPALSVLPLFSRMAGDDGEPVSRLFPAAPAPERTFTSAEGEGMVVELPMPEREEPFWASRPPSMRSPCDRPPLLRPSVAGAELLFPVAGAVDVRAPVRLPLRDSTDRLPPVAVTPSPRLRPVRTSVLFCPLRTAEAFRPSPFRDPWVRA